MNDKESGRRPAVAEFGGRMLSRALVAGALLSGLNALIQVFRMAIAAAGRHL